VATSYTVLHVDDDLNDLTLFQHACRRANVSFTLRALPEAEQAQDYLAGKGIYADRSQYPLPSLLLLDLKMPRLSGGDLLLWLRQHESLKTLPVVVFSSSRQSKDVKQAYENGANSYLVKPLDLEGLVQIAKMIEAYWINLSRKPNRD
jgi:CheY-like chemotaxis protein